MTTNETLSESDNKNLNALNEFMGKQDPKIMAEALTNLSWDIMQESLEENSNIQLASDDIYYMRCVIDFLNKLSSK